MRGGSRRSAGRKGKGRGGRGSAHLPDGGETGAAQVENAEKTRAREGEVSDALEARPEGDGGDVLAAVEGSLRSKGECGYGVASAASQLGGEGGQAHFSNSCHQRAVGDSSARVDGGAAASASIATSHRHKHLRARAWELWQNKESKRLTRRAATTVNGV